MGKIYRERRPLIREETEEQECSDQAKTAARLYAVTSALDARSQPERQRPRTSSIVMAFSDVFLGLTALFAAVALGTIIMSRPSTQGVPGGDH